MPLLTSQGVEDLHRLDTAAALERNPTSVRSQPIFMEQTHWGRFEETAFCEANFVLAPDNPRVWWRYHFREANRIGGTELGDPPEVDFAPTIFDSSDTRGTDWIDELLWSVVEESGKRVLHLLLNQISEYRRLPEDWDGYGGMPTTSEAAKEAEQILSRTTRLAVRLRVEPSVGPLADGGLDIEWTSLAGNELLLEVPPGAD